MIYNQFKALLIAPLLVTITNSMFSQEEKIEIEGAIVLSNSESSTPLEGTIRWNSITQDFEGYNGIKWLSLTQRTSIWGPFSKSVQENQKIVLQDDLGVRVGISGDILLVGRPSFERVSFYRFQDNTWFNGIERTGSNGQIGDQFGSSVSIDGNYSVIGAYLDDVNGTTSGSIYTFEKLASNNYIEQNQLIPLDGADDDLFGISTAISGDYLISGSPNDDDNGFNSGAAYILIRFGDNWGQQAKLKPSVGAQLEQFGLSVDIDGDYAIVGSPSNSSNSGSAYIFVRNGSSWSEQDKLTPAGGNAGDQFGTSVSIEGDYAVVGSVGDDSIATQSGAVFVFKRSGSDWNQVARLKASDAANGDSFGTSSSIFGDYIAIGASGDDDNGSGSGSAYVFHRSGNSWGQQAKFVPSDGSANDKFGFHISGSGTTIVVGANSGVYSFLQQK